jgi:alkane 1-monooxygenase
MESKFRNLGYFLSLFPSFLVIIGNLSGNVFTLLNIIFAFGFLVGVDWFFTENREKINKGSAIIPNSVLVIHVIVHTTAIGTLIYGVFNGIIVDYFIFTAVLSTGINSGMSGIIVAHELIHRSEKYWRVLGLWNLWTVNYLHWYIEHIRVHHKYVGILERDAATAKYGESIYHFVMRTIPQQYISAFRNEIDYLKKRNRNKLLANFVIQGTLVSLITWIILLITLGPVILGIFIGQALVAVTLLEMVNYAEHYGLVRDDKESVGYEHSWQTDNRFSRFMLLELVRHSDHHYSAGKPYHTLESHEESPILPTGYWGMFPFALIPPLWFKLIHPRLKSFQNSNK